MLALRNREGSGTRGKWLLKDQRAAHRQWDFQIRRALWRSGPTHYSAMLPSTRRRGGSWRLAYRDLLPDQRPPPSAAPHCLRPCLRRSTPSPHSTTSPYGQPEPGLNSPLGSKFGASPRGGQLFKGHWVKTAEAISLGAMIAATELAVLSSRSSRCPQGAAWIIQAIEFLFLIVRRALH